MVLFVQQERTDDPRRRPSAHWGETYQMATCENCGSFVTNRFVRVFGNGDNQVFACLNCSTNTELIEGFGAIDLR